MKNRILFALVSLFLFGLLSGCGQTPAGCDITTPAGTVPTPEPTEAPPTFDFKSTNLFDGYAEVTVQSVEAAESIVPPVPGSIYTSYVADTGNVYLDIVCSVTYLGTSSIQANTLFQYSIDAGKTTYTGFPVVEADNGADLEFNAIIAPLSTQKVHFLAQIPKDALEGDLTVSFATIGQPMETAFRYDKA